MYSEKQKIHIIENFLIGNVVNNIVIIMCGARWVLEIWGNM